MSTFLNPNAIEDSSIAKSKLDTALKTEIDGKQDTLTAGAGINIIDNTISCTLDTTIFKVVDSLPTAPASGDENKIHLVLSSSSEGGNTYDEYLWVNNSWERIGSFRPSVDLSRYAEKSYVDSQIEGEATARTNADAELQTQINGKQEALTLTVKDNGNIVLANIQGQSKEFMPATPSGDPMHYAYVNVGAEYNDTGADIIKDAPWADMIDDDYTGDYGKTVIHKAGYWYLNGLGDLTNRNMQIIYTRSILCDISNQSMRFYIGKTNAIFFNFLVTNPITSGNSYVSSSCKTIVINDSMYGNRSMLNGESQFYYSKYLLHIIGAFVDNTKKLNNVFTMCNSLITLKFYGLKNNVSFSDSSNLSIKSVLYMINNERATSPIAITLHKTVYDRCTANNAITTALQTHTNVSLASAQ